MPKKDQSAPAALELLRRFVNSSDVEGGTDQLSDDETAARWLAGHGFSTGRITPEEVARLRELREALRGALLANGGDADPAETWDALASAFSGSVLGLEFSGIGQARLAPLAAAIVPQVTGRLAAAMYDALRDGTWRRLKACRKHSCLWAFYDHSKNGSGAWCNMATCGNRVKAQRRRARARA